MENDPKSEESLHELEAKLKVLASCTYEENTQWGKETGLKYGCPVEDVITGLSIQCKGWRSVYFNPERKAFVGVAPITLPQTLVQHKRWSEGNFLILLSKYRPAWVVKKLAMDASDIRYLDRMAMQILLCVVMVLINWPLYQALFFRQDKGKMPSSLTCESIGFALLACTCFVYLQ
ncbi:hypothetical protein Ddye_027432 [Dipteronia dyeriana]|uniref:Uncharacterized protein n=1 Tax=Dipteronia dyeriana TaxID=168575 RepID=A0AAD9TP56_9ROSI|nr:hypothetical protein Ddye_027432 [Dipteronia dyeriana]